jgi:dTDP-4-amino-4,6-dideoxygalactose transaminase
MIPYSKQTITEDDIKAVSDCLESDWIAGNGPVVQEFEEALCEYTGYKYCVLTNSATSALFVAYRAYGFRQYKRITMPTLTFVATANMCPNVATLVDVDPISLVRNNLDVGVSYTGYPVYDCCIADNAHSLVPDMALWDNVVSVLSFHPLKAITTGEGGAILTSSPAIWQTARKMVDHGRMKQGDNYGNGHNFRMPSINAALGLSQLQRADANLAWRRKIADWYTESMPLSILPDWHEDHSYHLFVLRIPHDRDWFKDELHKLGIGTQIHYPPLYTYPHIGGHPSDYPNTSRAYKEILSIPIYSGMTKDDANTVMNAVEKVYEEWAREK